MINKTNGRTQRVENETIEGHKGTWYLISISIFNDTIYKLWESEDFGENAPSIITSDNGIILENVFNGFDDLYEYLAWEDNMSKFERIGNGFWVTMEDIPYIFASDTMEYTKGIYYDISGENTHWFEKVADFRNEEEF